MEQINKGLLFGVVFLFFGLPISACGSSSEQEAAINSSISSPTPVPLLSPPARGYHRMAYDVESDRAILFGGMGIVKGMLEDTWAYDLSANSWMKMAPAQSPPPGYGPMAYDIQSDRVILFMGFIDTGTYPDNGVYKTASETHSSKLPFLVGEEVTDIGASPAPNSETCTNCPG